MQAAQKQLREVRNTAVESNDHFERELATAQRLSALYKANAEDRSARCTELEGIVRELKQHMQVGRASMHETVSHSHGAAESYCPFCACLAHQRVHQVLRMHS